MILLILFKILFYIWVLLIFQHRFIYKKKEEDLAYGSGMSPAGTALIPLPVPLWGSHSPPWGSRGWV
jgi:hypothetical protein